MNTLICNKYNSDDGCGWGEKCKYRHVLYCTFSVCVSLNQQHTHTFEDCGRKGRKTTVRKMCTNPLCQGAAAKTHTFEDCGRKGGPKHGLHIEKKKEEAMAAKHDAKVVLMEELYPEILKLVLEGDTYDQFMAMCSELHAYINPPVPEGSEIIPPAERLARRIAGMILERKISEIRSVMSNHGALVDEMSNAVIVLVEAAKKASTPAAE